MKIDKRYAASSYLMFRKVFDETKAFDERYPVFTYQPLKNRIPVSNSFHLEDALKKQVEEATKDGKAALMLSGGIDSAILAKFMPKGSTVYTLKCIVPGMKVTDETIDAARYAKECGLIHKVIEIYWEDFDKYSPALMKHKGAPIHSIEVQIYKAAEHAKKDGFNKLIFGESADCLYGGLSNLLSREWSFGEFVDRYSFVLPYKVLRDSVLELEPYKIYEKEGYIDVNKFLQNIFFIESVGSYANACNVANMGLVLPYANTFMNVPLDYERVRAGQNKYIIREIFERFYPWLSVPPKTPMPRPTTEWMRNWKGPTRSEFLPNCISTLTGDQKWLVYSLEKFLNMIDN